LEASMLYGLSYITDEMIDDSMTSIVALLGQEFPKEFESVIFQELLRGTGAGELEGVFNCPSLITISKETSQAADTINAQNILKMRERAWNYGSGYVWYITPDAYRQIFNLHVESTNNAGIVKLYHESLTSDMPSTLLGAPVVFSEYMKTVGDLGDILLVRWDQYYYGLLKPLQQASSVHVRFDVGETCYKFFMRNAGRTPWRDTLIPKFSQDGTFTMSPFITLEARA
jgi:HK97 family phage major capsid protein